MWIELDGTDLDVGRHQAAIFHFLDATAAVQTVARAEDGLQFSRRAAAGKTKYVAEEAHNHLLASVAPNGTVGFESRFGPDYRVVRLRFSSTTFPFVESGVHKRTEVSKPAEMRIPVSAR